MTDEVGREDVRADEGEEEEGAEGFVTDEDEFTEDTLDFLDDGWDRFPSD